MSLTKDHPFATGAAVGALGLLVWFKRGWFIGMFRRATSVFHGFGEAGVPGALTALTFPGASDSAPIAIRQIRRYAFAASQDQSPVVGLTHASYALILLDTIEEMMGRDAVQKMAGVDPAKIRQFITLQQDRHAEQLQPCDRYLQVVLKMERESGKPGFMLQGGAAPRGA
jgi:hypothetical protein